LEASVNALEREDRNLFKKREKEESESIYKMGNNLRE
jgi:hypothetical protein